MKTDERIYSIYLPPTAAEITPLYIVRRGSGDTYLGRPTSLAGAYDALLASLRTFVGEETWEA